MVWNKGTKGVCKPNSSSFKKGQIPWNKGKVGVGPIPWNKGLTGLPPRHTTKHSEETKRKCSIATKERWASGYYSNRPKHSQETKDKIGLSNKRGIIKNCIVCNKQFYCSPSFDDKKYCSKVCNGKDKSMGNHPNWKGGSSFKNPYKHRRNADYKNWRKSVFERDEYTCQLCFKSGKYLVPHHILSYTDYPKERYNTENGMTVCEDCHKIIHFGKEEQIRRIYYARIS
jgi:5-methylcytosine-specific restriction endonuclease McrA